MRRMVAILAAGVAAMAAPALAQHAGHHMPAEQAADPHAGHDMSAMPGMEGGSTPAADPHAGHVMPAEPAPADAHAGHDAAGPGAVVGDAPPPEPPADHAADRYYAPADMAASRAQLHREHGGGTFAQVTFDLAEYRVRDGQDGYAWEAEGWYGGDIHRAVFKTEGEGAFGNAVETAEFQLLYSYALDPYWNLQGGIRHDVRPDPSRTYAVLGIEGAAPYWLEVEAALFLSNKGDLQARAEAGYDQRITQRLILQPRGEVEFAAQDVPELGIGSGLSSAELGLRLRYEIVREFAPYVGVHMERTFGDTARFARAEGHGRSSTAFVMGVRAWF